MSERYSRLFALSENLHANGSPVVIAAGALLKDNQTGKVVAQLKLHSIDARKIKAATVCVIPFDTVGNPIGDSVRYQYLDLNVARNEEFGQKTAIALPNSATRSFAVTVEEVVFNTNTVWNATGEPWEALPVPSFIGRIYGVEFEKQFRIKYGSDCQNLPLFKKDLWFCACGALNRTGEANCHICGKSYAMLNSINFETIRTEMEARMAAEREQAAKDAEAARIKEEAAREKAKKASKIALIVGPVLAVILVAVVIVSGMMKKNDAYDNALALMDAGQYEEAIKAFTSLDGYKDSADQIKAAEEALAEIARAAELEETYNNAIQLLESNVSANENEAYHILMELGNYKDAAELLTNFQYQIIAEEADCTVDSGDYLRFYEYDTRGLLTDKSYDGGATLSFVYDEKGRLTKEHWNDWQSTQYWYNDNGTLKKTKHALSRAVSTNIVSYATTEYDDQGYPIRVTNEFDYDVWEYQYNYATDGTIDTIQISRRYIKANEADDMIVIDMSEYNCSELQQTPTLRFPLFWVVSEDGSKKTSYKLVDSVLNGVTIKENNVYEYDSYGNLTREIQYDNAGNQTFNYSYENSYDEKGNLVETKRQNAGSDIIVTYTYVYGYIYTPNAA